MSYKLSVILAFCAIAVSGCASVSVGINSEVNRQPKAPFNRILLIADFGDKSFTNQLDEYPKFTKEYSEAVQTCGVSVEAHKSESALSIQGSVNKYIDEFKPDGVLQVIWKSRELKNSTYTEKFTIQLTSMSEKIEVWKASLNLVMVGNPWGTFTADLVNQMARGGFIPAACTGSAGPDHPASR